jgi:hypothetical protein
MRNGWFTDDHDIQASAGGDAVPTVDTAAGDEGIDDPDVSAIDALPGEPVIGSGPRSEGWPAAGRKGWYVRDSRR